MRIATGTLLLAIFLGGCGNGDATRLDDTAGAQVDADIAERVRRLASPSVLNVLGLQFDRDTAQHIRSGQGSAVAFGGGVFLTDCRNIVGADHLVLQQGRVREMVTLADDYAGDDVCVLTSEDVSGTAVLGIRDIASIQLGETVFAVGYPTARGTTVAQAVVTAKRENPRGVWIDSTLPATPEWAGAGLFDREGALIGIAATAAPDTRQAGTVAIMTPSITQVLARSAAGLDLALASSALIEPSAGPEGSTPRGAANFSSEERASLESFFGNQDRGGDNEQSRDSGGDTGGDSGADTGRGDTGGGDSGGDSGAGDTGGGDSDSGDGNGGGDSGGGNGNGGNGGSDSGGDSDSAGGDGNGGDDSGSDSGGGNGGGDSGGGNGNGGGGGDSGADTGGGNGNGNGGGDSGGGNGNGGGGSN